jgi:uncharacterized protein YbaP (TraB family)
MKRSFWLGIFAALGFAACSQTPKVKTTTAASNNTLLWKISGKNLAKPSYLFGTMHMLCADDIQISDSLKNAIKEADRVYLELDMDNLFEMMGAMGHMSMKNDTTLADLLSEADYKKVKAYFEQHSSMLPFSMLETFKPLLIESMIMEQMPQCDNMIVMEQLVMEEAKQNSKDIKGLETMDYQLSIFDSIPYKLQAKQLLDMVNNAGKSDTKELDELTSAYRNQELNKMDELTQKEDMGIKNFTNILLYNRNINWVAKLQPLMQKNSLVVAVGAGHLPGAKGVINLLRLAGYKVEPVQNNMTKKKTKEI